MALNYSQRPIFPAHTSEDNPISPLRIVNGYVVEGMTEKPRHGTVEIHDCFSYGREMVGKNDPPDPASADIIDLLPLDPFGMDIDINTTYTAITGWLEDLEVDYGAYVGTNIVNTNEDYGFFAELNMIWNFAMRFQPCYPSNETPDDKGSVGCMTFNDGTTSAVFTESEDLADDFDQSSNAVGRDPHEAFVLALSYLGTKDLLLVERVSRSLCFTIHNDPLLWRDICIDQPLNERITDDVLLQLTNRAEGNLCSLTLVKCPRITDDGLKRVLETNPKLTKLSLPGCTRLSIEGILVNLKAFKSNESSSGVKQIRTGGFYGVTHDHFKDLKLILGSDDTHQSNYRPHYYHRGNLCLPSDDNRDIDVEICPRCQNVRLVYNCPADSCQVKDGSADLCRACVICIPRCAQCGRCVHNSEYEETFSLEYLCSGCIMELPGGTTNGG